MAVQKRESLVGLGVAALLLLLVASTCRGAPAFEPKPWADEAAPPAILARSRDPLTGRCYGWLPIVDPRLDAYDVQPEFEYDRVQPVHVREVEKMGDPTWRDAAAAYAGEAADSTRNLAAHATGNQVPVGKVSKKDVFMSRGWGAGGMPFSVLYMSPRTNHQQPSSGSQTDTTKNASSDPSRRTGEASSSSPATNGRSGQSNNRVSVRNGAYPQSRKHYSIIPQLFISYGWGPSGK